MSIEVYNQLIINQDNWWLAIDHLKPTFLCISDDYHMEKIIDNLINTPIFLIKKKKKPTQQLWKNNNQPTQV